MRAFQLAGLLLDLGNLSFEVLPTVEPVPFDLSLLVHDPPLWF